jgi:uncharacterized protein YkwD
LNAPTQTSTAEICTANAQVRDEAFYQALTQLPYQHSASYSKNAVVITQPKDGLVHSIAVEKTVLKKATGNDTAQEIDVTPAPLAPATSDALLQSTNYVQSTPQPATSAPTSSGSVLNADVLFNMVNAYRSSIGLASFQKDERICSVAASRGPELDNEIYVTHTMHAGFYARNLPYWATENMISMQTEQQALDWWLHSPVHRAAIEGDYKYACTGCYGRSCDMIFTNFSPK